MDPPSQHNNTTTMVDTTTKQHDLLSFVDSQVYQAAQPWSTPLVASACFVDLPQLQIPPRGFSQLNIVDYLKRPLHHTPSGHIYFNTNQYPIKDDQGKSALDQLAIDLGRCARANGFELIRNGNVQRKESFSPFFPAKFRCACSRATRSTSKKDNAQQVKPTCFHNDRAKNRREKGKEQSRKSEFKRPATSDAVCTFGFLVHCDKFGLYLKASYGNAMHRNHSQLPTASITASIRTINQQSRMELDKLAKSGMSAAQARNYLHHNEELKGLSYKQIYRYFCDSNSERIGSLLQKGNVPEDCLPPPKSKLIDFLRSRSDISYNVYTGGCPDAANGRNFWLFNESGSPGKPNSIVPLDELCPDAVEKYKEQRQDERLDSTKLQLVGAAWCTLKQKRLLLLDPSVIKIDATSDTNNESRDLLTFTSRAPTGQYFICLQVFMPDARPSTFRWVFQVVLPDLLGQDVMNRIQMLMTDGDSHEIDELRKAIKLFMPWVYQGRCAWHIVYKGYDRRCPGVRAFGTDPNQQNAYRKMAQFLRTWAYSWMYSGFCESRDEFLVSACLFQAFFDSPTVWKAFAFKQDQLAVVREFFCNYVFNVVEDYAFYPRKFIRHYDECTNSSHEGTNFGLKNHSTPVLPSMSLSRSAQVQTLQSDLKMASIERQAASLLVHQPTWVQSLTSAYILPLAESILQQESMLVPKYIVRRNGNTWRVALNYVDNPTFFTNTMDGDVCKKLRKFLPRFRHVRTVTPDANGCCQCSCGFFQRFGIPCRHLHAVAKFENPSFVGFTHHCVSVIWLRSYSHFAYTRDHNSEPVSQALEALSRDDIAGPRILQHVSEDQLKNRHHYQSKFDTLFVERSAIESCWNYHREEVLNCVKKYSSHVGSSTTISYALRDHQNVATFHGEDDMFAMDQGDDSDGEVDNTIIEEATIGARARSALMPAMKELLTLYEAPNVVSSEVPWKPLLDEINRHIRELRSTIAEDPQYSLSQMSQQSTATYVSTRRDRNPRTKRTYVAHHGFQSKRRKDK